MFDIKKIQQMQQQMQEEIGKVQEEMGRQTIEASSGGGAVTVAMNGNQEVQSIKIQPDAVDPDDLEMLEDLVMAAVNAAVEKSRAMQQGAMGKVAGGMLPPGMNLPFM
ncbi:YbaB/EbfC family nucleoid-associated protein [Candidatus Sumerlaeota bacterium]|nr:YbaB/EbfC family nucleoid-associated protein [Candidatus Sumerlaeota bacterium]